MYKYAVGQGVTLSNYMTKYGYNGIAVRNWGKAATINGIDPRGHLFTGSPCYYVLTQDGGEHHVTEEMLSDPTGPW